MIQAELDALLIEVDMPRAVEAELREGEIKLSLIFADRADSIKVAATFGRFVDIPESKVDLYYTMKIFAGSARSIVDEQHAEGLVPYYSIPRDPETLIEIPIT